MPRTAAAKLTSEERCRKAYEKEFDPLLSLALEGDRDFEIAEANLWQGWVTCWRYLELRVTDYIEK